MTIFREGNRFWVDNLGKENFFRTCRFGGSKLQGTLRAAENFIKTPLYLSGKVDRVSQPGFKSDRPLSGTLSR